MREILNVKPIANFILLLEFENGKERKFDLNPFFKSSRFKPFNDPEKFKPVTNKKYFIGRIPFEIDLSADELWHESK